MPRAHGDDGWRPEKPSGQPLSDAYALPAGLAAGGSGVLESDLVDRREHRLELRTSGWRRLRSYLVVARPSQWVKNLLVVAAPAAAGVLVHQHVPLRVFAAFVAFCLLSAGTYIVNDVRDAGEDRAHPRKRHRPIAAGELDPPAALRVAAALMLGGLGICFLVRPLLSAVGAGYLAVTLTYCFLWRRVAVADVAAIAACFVLRAVAGAVAAPVHLSRAFLLVVTFGAVFVAAGKRHAELVQALGGGDGGRRVLSVYTARRLRQAMVASSLLAAVAYCGWAFELVPGHGVPWRALTVLPFAACLLRYGFLLRRGDGEAPEELLLEDRPLQLLVLSWTLLFALSVHAAS